MIVDLKFWAEINFGTFGLVGEFDNYKINNFDVVEAQENIHLGGEHVYFFKERGVIYAVTGPSEDFIKYIILNGKW